LKESSRKPFTKLAVCKRPIVATCDAFVVPSVQPPPRAAKLGAAPLHIIACDAAGAAVPEPPSSPFGKVKSWYLKYWKVDKAQLRALGVDAVFMYGVLSNFNVAMLATLSWFVASQATGLSPLAPGQWKYFVGTYVGFYGSLGFIIRPFRVALTFSTTPLYSLFVERVRRFLPLRSKFPKLNRTLAIVFVSILLNVAGTFGLIALGASFAGLLAGVPAVPPGWSYSDWRAAEQPLNVMKQIKALSKQVRTPA